MKEKCCIIKKRGHPRTWSVKPGFSSQSYASGRAAQILRKPDSELRLITCHLGNGCSLTAVKNGVSIDTTMGFTPLEGLMMGTRSGSIDPAIVIYLMRKYNYDADKLDKMLNKASGLKGIMGKSGRDRHVLQAIASGDEQAQLAFDMYVHSLRASIGSMVASLGGLDALVFTAGVGENAAAVREATCAGFEFLGLKLDKEKNLSSPKDMDIATPDSAVRVLVVQTAEDWASSPAVGRADRLPGSKRMEEKRMQNKIRERSLSYIEIFGTGFEILKDNITKIAAIALAVFIPISLIAELSTGWLFRPIAELYAGGRQPVPEEMQVAFSQIPITNWIVFYGIFLIVSFVAFPLSFMAICYVVEQSILGDPVSWQDALKHSFSRLGSAIGTYFLVVAFMLLWSLLFIVGGLIPVFYYQYAIYVVALRGKEGGKALKYSSDLVKKRWGTIFIVLLTIGIAKTIVTNVLSNLMQPQVLGTDWSGLVLTIISYFLMAFFITINTVLFLNIDYSLDRETV